VHDILERFSRAVGEMESEYIFWPESNEDAADVVRCIEELRGLPGCIGIIDCSHIEIPAHRSMGVDRTKYISYKKRWGVREPGGECESRGARVSPPHTPCSSHTAISRSRHLLQRRPLQRPGRLIETPPVVPLSPPPSLNRYTLILQAVVDGAGNFTSAIAGWPGSLNDCTVFAQTDIYARLSASIYKPDYPGRYLLADSGFVLRVFCMRGFAYDTTNEKEKVFNAYAHTTRVVVENTFGRYACALAVPRLVLCPVCRAAVEQRQSAHHAPTTQCRVTPSHPHCTLASERAVSRRASGLCIVALAALRTPPSNRATRIAAPLLDPAAHRRLRYLNVDLKLAPMIILTCCILHNFIQLHQGESSATPPMTQRDTHTEPPALSASARVRAGVNRRARGLRIAALARRAGQQPLSSTPLAGTPPCQDPLGNLGAGKAMRDELTDYCWTLHQRRGDADVALFAQAYAASLQHGDADDEYWSDNDSGFEM